jgi:hypothetical protein
MLVRVVMTGDAAMGNVELRPLAVVVVLARGIVGLTLVGAAMSKLPRRQQFAFVVMAYRVLPRSAALVYARLLPWLELLLGTLLLVGKGTRIAAAGSGLLLASFTVALGMNIMRGRLELDCGCFGGRARTRISGRLVMRNFGLIWLAWFVALAPPMRRTRGTASGKALRSRQVDPEGHKEMFALGLLAGIMWYPLWRQGTALRIAIATRALR